jgi:hypothetical protein
VSPVKLRLSNCVRHGNLVNNGLTVSMSQMLEVHYENTGAEEGLLDSTGFEVGPSHLYYPSLSRGFKSLCPYSGFPEVRSSISCVCSSSTPPPSAVTMPPCWSRVPPLLTTISVSPRPSPSPRASLHTITSASVHPTRRGPYSTGLLPIPQQWGRGKRVCQMCQRGRRL